MKILGQLIPIKRRMTPVTLSEAHQLAAQLTARMILNRMMSFAALLRIRDTLPHGILRASWTLYQPHALVWDYSYWNGKSAFGRQAGDLANKIPNLKWERIVPPPFVSPWRQFLKILKEKKGSCSEMDAILGPLLPMTLAFFLLDRPPLQICLRFATQFCCHALRSGSCPFFFDAILASTRILAPIISHV